MDELIVDILVVLIGIPLFVIGFYLWAKIMRHMNGMTKNFKPNMYWGRLLFICIFIPNFFTEKGNFHRKELLKYGGLFSVYCSLPFLISGLWRVLSN